MTKRLVYAAYGALLITEVWLVIWLACALADAWAAR